MRTTVKRQALAALAGITCGLVGTFDASAATEQVPTVDTFSPQAGFAKAILERQPIVVGVPPAFWDGPTDVESRLAWIQPVLDAWNEAAGWEVLVTTPNDAEADVTFRTVENDMPRCGADAGACTWIDEFTAGEYRFEHCFIEFWPWYPHSDDVAHELGHCFGFIDMGYEPANGYRGVMMYGREWGATPVNEYDIASLVEAGYRDAP